MQNIEAFICDISLVVFIFKKASKTEFCIDGQYNSVCNFPFFFLSWERAWVENFVVLESPWTKIGKIWDRNKIPPQDVLHLLVKGKNMNTWNKIRGEWKLRGWMMDKNFVFLLLAHSHFHFRRSVFSSLLCKAYFSENGENGKSIKWTATSGKTLT